MLKIALLWTHIFTYQRVGTPFPLPNLKNELGLQHGGAGISADHMGKVVHRGPELLWMAHLLHKDHQGPLTGKSCHLRMACSTV